MWTIAPPSATYEPTKKTGTVRPQHSTVSFSFK